MTHYWYAARERAEEAKDGGYEYVYGVSPTQVLTMLDEIEHLKDLLGKCVMTTPKPEDIEAAIVALSQ
ncbi:MAG TPA: hypothetical protein VMV81_13000 [Phycisphaerae bacterium]|nr:hypothetical protein [Phycisphaerae bacterium]